MIESQPEDPDALFNLGVVLHMQGHPADAIADFREVVRVQPNAIDARMSLGDLCLAHDGETDEAVSELRTGRRHPARRRGRLV